MLLHVGGGHVWVLQAKHPLLNFRHTIVHLKCLIVLALHFSNVSNILPDVSHLKAVLAKHLQPDLQRLIIHLLGLFKLALLFQDDANVFLQQDMQ